MLSEESRCAGTALSSAQDVPGRAPLLAAYLWFSCTLRTPRKKGSLSWSTNKGLTRGTRAVALCRCCPVASLSEVGGAPSHPLRPPTARNCAGQPGGMGLGKRANLGVSRWVNCFEGTPTKLHHFVGKPTGNHCFGASCPHFAVEHLSVKSEHPLWWWAGHGCKPI